MSSKVFEVMIIGSGPAGLTAAIYASRANLATGLLTGDKWGGQLMLTTEVENFPGFPEGIMGPQLMENMRIQAQRFGTKIFMERANRIVKKNELFEVISNEQSFQAKSVILAMGADARWLGVEGEEKFIGRGVSSCAPCDAAFFRNKRVYVVGGGDSAMEEALFLTKFASEVVIIHRRDSFRASKIMVERIMNHPKIKVFWDSEIVAFRGEKVIDSVMIRTRIDRYEQDGAKMNEGNKYNFVERQNGSMVWQSSVDGVFVAIGHTPNSEFVRDLVTVDEKGYVLRSKGDTSRTYQTMTQVEGIFVAGDVYDHVYKQAVTAAASGCAAALDCEKWLEDMQ